MQCPSAHRITPPMPFLFVGPRTAYSFLRTVPRGSALAVRLRVPLMRAPSGLARKHSSCYPYSVRTLYNRAMPGAHNPLQPTRAHTARASELYVGQFNMVNIPYLW